MPSLDALPDEASAPAADALPTLVSFYAGDRYYHDAADLLRADCERLGMPHHIVELDAEELDWARICRLKVAFYREMHERFGAVLWVDVDSRLVRIPELLRGCRFDLAGFAGRYRYIRDYDPYAATRFWVPSFLFVGSGERAGAFVEHMATLEAATTDPVTDDWVLHEAWTTHGEQLSVGFLPPEIVARRPADVTEATVFLHGDSGNVGGFRGHVLQHERRSDDPVMRARYLGAEAVDTMKAGDRASAILLARHAYRAHPTDSEALMRLSRYLRLAGERGEANALLLDHLQALPDQASVREEAVRALLQAGDFDACEQHLSVLRDHTEPSVRAVAESLADDVARERRARTLGVPSVRRPVVWWRRAPDAVSFADALSPWLVEQVTGLPARAGRREASLLAGGSDVRYATAASTVWGSGIAGPTDRPAADAAYLAVRGPLTRDRAAAAGATVPEVYGDPTLLLPRFLPRAEGPPTHRLGIVRHPVHTARDVRVEGVRDIHLGGAGEATIRRVVAEVTDCEAILTTSLHGLMVAQAYGIPARWCTFGDDIGGGDHEVTWRDHAAAVGIALEEPLDLAGLEALDDRLATQVPPRPPQVDVAALAEGLVQALGGR